MPLHKIRLELARTHEFPEGSNARGYEFWAPLTADRHLDADAFPAVRKDCRVRRFWAEEPERTGTLHHTRRRTWAFSYGPGDEDDEDFFHLESHAFRPGEYVSIRETDGETLPFRVVSVT